MRLSHVQKSPLKCYIVSLYHGQFGRDGFFSLDRQGNEKSKRPRFKPLFCVHALIANLVQSKRN